MCEWLLKLSNAENSPKWSWVPSIYLKHFGSKLSCFLSTIGTKEFKGLNSIQSIFWKNTSKVWLSYNKSHTYPTKEDNCIWNNSDVTYRGKVLFFEKWTSKINFVRDILQNNTIKGYEAIEELIGFSPNLRLEYVVVYNAVTNFLSRGRNKVSNDPLLPGLVINDKICLKARDFRQLIIDTKYTEPCAAHFWKNKLNLQINDNIWKLAYNTTRESRLRELQWKILHNLYPTNILLQKMGEAQNNLCSLCQNEIDYIEHFFFHCPKISELWSYISNIINKDSEQRITLTAESVLFGIQSSKMPNLNQMQCKFINHLILIGKMCVGKFRYGIPLNIKIMFEMECSIRKLVI